MKTNWPLLLAWAISSAATAQVVHEPLKVHILKEGETLSELLYSDEFKPLYGRKNWVEKTLELNRLTLEEAKKVKTGFPVILPAYEIEEAVVVKEASVSKIERKGLFGGRVSEKINLNLEFGYFYQSAQTKTESIDLQENYHLGLNIKSNERYEVSENVWLRPTLNLTYQSQNTLAFNNNANVDANFIPTYEVGVGALTDYKNLPFTILTKVNVHEKSRLHQIQNEVDVRRDRRAQVVVGLNKIWERKHMVYGVTPYVSQSIWSQNTKDLSSDSILTLGMEGTVNLTEDSNLKAYLQNDAYNTDEDVTVMGINWDYQIK